MDVGTLRARALEALCPPWRIERTDAFGDPRIVLTLRVPNPNTGDYETAKRVLTLDEADALGRALAAMSSGS